MQESFAALLREEMGERSPTAFAREVGIDPSYVLHMLAGRKCPSLSVLARIGDACGWDDQRRGRALSLVARGPSSPDEAVA